MRGADRTGRALTAAAGLFASLSLVSLTFASLKPCAAVAQSARGGWVIDESVRTLDARGQAGPRQVVTLRIADGRVRIEQAQAVTIVDTRTDQITILNRQAGRYWAGSVGAYLTELSTVRGGLRRQPTPDTSAAAPPPRISVRQTGERVRIAGHVTTRFDITANDTLLEELWMASDIRLQPDLDVARFLALESKMSHQQGGAAAALFGALHENPEYQHLLATGFPLKAIIHGAAGGVMRTVVRIAASKVAPQLFEIPAAMKAAALAALFRRPYAHPRLAP